MKKIMTFIVSAVLIIFISCEVKYPTHPKITDLPTPGKFDHIIMAAIGASFTAGYQSGGLVDDFQKKSYPYLIATQMGKADDFQMGWLAKPGFGTADIQTGEAFGPLKFEGDSIAPRDPIPGGINGIEALLFAGGNAELPRPYDNLGIPGADLNDILTTTGFDPATGIGNPFFDLTLRNPNFGNTTELEQAIILQPTLVLMLLPGGNDYLGAALTGTAIVEPDDEFTITSKENHANRLTAIVDALQSKTKATILASNLAYPNVLPYVNMLDNFVFHVTPLAGTSEPVPVMLDSLFQPIDASGPLGLGLYIPLLTEETNTDIAHILLPAVSEYEENGLGIPDSMDLINMGLDVIAGSGTTALVIDGLMDAGLNPSGIPIPGSLTLTADEETIINNAVDGYNDNIASIAQSKELIVVDLKTAIEEVVQLPGTYGVTDFFVLLDKNTTMWSLDGVHPNDAGQALIAMKFIETINQELGLDITKVDPAEFTGQYSGSSVKRIAPGAIEQAVKIFIRR